MVVSVFDVLVAFDFDYKQAKNYWNDTLEAHFEVISEIQSGWNSSQIETQDYKYVEVDFNGSPRRVRMHALQHVSAPP